MSVMIANLFHRASKCPVACSLKFLLSVSFIYALHIAAYHQVDVSLYSYIWLVNLVGVIAILALAFHRNCEYRNMEKKED
jgi:hypothetical protein